MIAQRSQPVDPDAPAFRVEVLSPMSRGIATGRRLTGSASRRQCLVVDPDRRGVRSDERVRLPIGRCELSPNRLLAFQEDEQHDGDGNQPGQLG